MSDQIKQIASRIKELREIHGLSVHALAEELNVPVEVYSAYESGNTDIPVGFLYELAGKYKVELSAILVGEDPRLHTYSLVKKGKGMNVERREHYKYQNLAYNFIHKKAEPFLVTAEPDDAPVHYSSHPGQELVYVLEGTLEVIINGHQIAMDEGDTLFFDSSIKHGMKAMNGKAAKFLAIVLSL